MGQVPARRHGAQIGRVRRTEQGCHGTGDTTHACILIPTEKRLSMGVDRMERKSRAYIAQISEGLNNVKAGVFLASMPPIYNAGDRSAI